MKLDIILRTCDNIYTVHKSSNESSFRIPGSEFSKSDIMLVCINSLINSINLHKGDIRLIVVDDHSSNIESIKKVVNECIYPTEFIEVNGSGNGDSLKTCYEWALKNGRDYLFFVEDDYLHDSCCISEMLTDLEFFKTKLNGREVTLFPYDNIDNYIQSYKNNIPCFMTLGSKRHWRTVTNSTFTFMCSKEIIERYWYLFDRATQYGKDLSVSEDNTINLIWSAPYKGSGGAYLLSPMPSLSLHFHFKEHLSPYVNWEKWWEQSIIK